MRTLLRLTPLALALAAASCSSAPAGSDDEADAGAPSDSGTVSESDAATPPDAAIASDAATLPPDAGVAADAGSTADAGAAPSRLLFGFTEEQLAVCFSGQNYPCSALTDDETRRRQIKQLAPGLTVRFGGYETERTGFGYPGAAARRSFENVGTAGGQLEPSWLLGRAALAGYANFILAAPVTQTTSKVSGGVHVWSAADAQGALDAWKQAIDASGFAPPSFIEIGNEPWLYSAGNPDGYRNDPRGYVAKATPIAKAIRDRIVAFGWPTRIAVVVDVWPGTYFETSGKAVAFPTDTIALARTVAVNGPPVLQTHGYPLHSGYWCPKPGSVSDHSDIACVYALHTMLKAIKKAAPEADLIVTEDNYDAPTYPQAGVYLTLASLLTYSAGGVAYTWFGNNNYNHTGDRYELFNGTTPVPLLKNDVPKLAALLANAKPGDVTVTASGSMTVTAGGYKSLVNASTAPPAYANGTAPSNYDFNVGGRHVVVDLKALTVTWP